MFQAEKALVIMSCCLAKVVVFGHGRGKGQVIAA
jgi:hypothetical protein